MPGLAPETLSRGDDSLLRQMAACEEEHLYGLAGPLCRGRSMVQWDLCYMPLSVPLVSPQFIQACDRNTTAHMYDPFSKTAYPSSWIWRLAAQDSGDLWVTWLRDIFSASCILRLIFYVLIPSSDRLLLGSYK